LDVASLLYCAAGPSPGAHRDLPTRAAPAHVDLLPFATRKQHHSKLAPGDESRYGRALEGEKMSTLATPPRIGPAPAHPLAGATMSGADMILQVLADEGVDTIFGYSGGAILPTYDAVFRFNERRPADQQIRLIVPATEQGAGFMAAGYARSSGRVGVSLVTSGPGATNSVTPVRDCQADSVPMVLICGQVPRAAMGTDAFQEAPVFNIMAPCAKHVFLVTDEKKLEATMRRAFDIARSGRPGPVVVDIPRDVQLSQGVFTGAGLLPVRGYQERLDALNASTVSAAEAEAFYALLADAERPLIYAGGGVINGNAAGELRAFAERFGIPIVTTLMGIGGVDTTSELSLHMLGMHGTAYANYAVEDCDLLFAVGSRFDDRVAGKVKEFAPGAKIAHLDVDASEIGKVKNVDWSHVSDAKRGLTQLLKVGAGFKKSFARWRTHVQQLKGRHPLDYNRATDQIQVEYVLKTLNEITRGNAIVTTGVGQHQMWAAQYLDFTQPRTFLTSGSMGTMGFGLPAAIGAQLANPGKLVIDVDGDGSIRMNLGELETLTNYDIPVKVLLLNNLGDGMVRQWQDLFYQNRYSGSDKTLHKKDFVRAVEADGFAFAKRVTDPAEVRTRLEEFVGFAGPAFLEVMVDQTAHVYPMVAPGMGYKDMITGKYITSRSAAPKGKDEDPTGYF
jgi:acetolactate synthase-1/2/3 large subunit